MGLSEGRNCKSKYHTNPLPPSGLSGCWIRNACQTTTWMSPSTSKRHNCIPITPHDHVLKVIKRELIVLMLASLPS